MTLTKSYLEILENTLLDSINKKSLFKPYLVGDVEIRRILQYDINRCWSGLEDFRLWC